MKSRYQLPIQKCSKSPMMPDPRFLAIHIACAKVCNTRGIAEVIDKISEGWEKVKVLREDGSGYPSGCYAVLLEVFAF
jgi:hypothetical protein